MIKTETFYRLRHKDGKFFNGKGFNKLGKYYHYEHELNLDVTNLLDRSERPVDIARWMEQVSVVKEIHEIQEEDPEFSIDALSARLQEKTRISVALRKMPGARSYTWTRFAEELRIIFPDWNLNGFTHAVLFDGYRMNPAQSQIGARTVMKQMKLKRSQYRQGNNMLVFTDPAHVAVTKLIANEHIVHYLDISTI